MALTPIEDIKHAVMGGAKKAFKIYEKASGGYWLWHAPESYIQACVFIELSGLPGLYVTLESSPRKIQLDCKFKRDRRSDRMTDQQRFDILVWYGNGTPRIPIEVKKTFNSPDKCINDIDRMKPLANNPEINIQAGMLLAYTEAKKDQTILSRFEKIAQKTNSMLTPYICPNADDNGWRWGFGLFCI